MINIKSSLLINKGYYINKPIDPLPGNIVASITEPLPGYPADPGL